MQCEGRQKLRSNNSSYYLIGVVTEAGLTVDKFTMISRTYRKRLIVTIFITFLQLIPWKICGKKNHANSVLLISSISLHPNL